MIQEAKKFEGTVIYDVLTAVDSLYNDIDAGQKLWKAKSPMQCPDGCGSCCVHFEPEVYEAEALYLAAWMLEHQSVLPRLAMMLLRIETAAFSLTLIMPITVRCTEAGA